MKGKLLNNSDLASLTSIVTGGAAGWVAGPFAGIVVGVNSYIAVRFLQGRPVLPAIIPYPFRDDFVASAVAFDKLRLDMAGDALSSPLVFGSLASLADFETDILSGHSILSSLITEKIVKARAVLEQGGKGEQEMWSGFRDPKRFSSLEAATHRLGRRIQVNCASIFVGAAAALKGLRSEGTPVDLTFRERTGREQAIALRTKPTADYVVTASAPFLLDHSSGIKLYRRAFEICTGYQCILRRKGKRKAKPTIWIYPMSTAELQLQFIKKQARAGENLPFTNFDEQEIVSVADFANYERFLEPGDMMIAWQPLASQLLLDKNLFRVRGSDFHYTISMFYHESWDSHPLLRAALLAFKEAFIAEWTWAATHPVQSWLRLVIDSDFLRSLSQGSAVNRRSR
jgi:hypothetical protein